MAARNKLDVVNFNIGIGPAFGLNLHAGRNLSVGFGLEYHYLAIGEVLSIDAPFLNETRRLTGKRASRERFDQHLLQGERRSVRSTIPLATLDHLRRFA